MMQASEIILGLLIILLVGWTIMLAVQQQGLSLGLQALEAKQIAQGMQISPAACEQVEGKTIVKAPDLASKEYFITVGFDSEEKQAYFCFYE